ncbi:hypothetical protein [Paenibacillus sp. W2I17]|uniref:hypothetical protein n=1 Tax=Paenibacillus sp. W2I17 TaxID=3042311 RepID=UPI002785FA85|nr:hypothetical protein [Paenibacillus sp. W2I17]MDQ0656988.1 catechol 2,3-dioxygenase-like lactoylglutathione lyase family enzyme [Paenibacillus sp. W2I17]
MILGLYEAHLPVSNLHQSIEFYSKLGLELAWRDEDTAFFWIEKEKSWDDPDGNSLELMCFVSVPENLKNISNKLSIEEWEDLLKDKN